MKISTHVLSEGGTFIANIFCGRDVRLLYGKLRLLFDRASVAKPSSSINSYIEALVICQVFKGGKEFTDLPLEGVTILVASPNKSQAMPKAEAKAQ